MYLYVRSTSQESEWSYICKLGLQSLPVPSQESEWSCICMLGVQARRVSDHVFVYWEYKPGE